MHSLIFSWQKKQLGGAIFYWLYFNFWVWGVYRSVFTENLCKFNKAGKETVVRKRLCGFATAVLSIARSHKSPDRLNSPIA
ncbi:hypothetical protein D0A34_12645 [Microcoleus vaginatus PCC 9802]|nr:hypothetical protein D0A34_12645 [Microcoleus vaginatus PCC 9802]